LALLFIPFTAFAEDFEQDGQINWGRGECHSQYYQIKLDDNTIDPSGDAQIDVGFCNSLSGTNLGIAGNESQWKCESPPGITTRIKDIWYYVSADEALSIFEQCKVGLSIDWAGVKPYTYEAWTIIDVGDDTTTIANCDEIYNPEADGSIDDTKNVCHVSDPIGTFIATSGGDANNNGWRILIDEADSGTPSCTGMESLIIVVKAEICQVPLQ